MSRLARHESLAASCLVLDWISPWTTSPSCAHLPALAPASHLPPCPRLLPLVLPLLQQGLSSLPLTRASPLSRLSHPLLLPPKPTLLRQLLLQMIRRRMTQRRRRQRDQILTMPRRHPTALPPSPSARQTHRKTLARLLLPRRTVPRLLQRLASMPQLHHHRLPLLCPGSLPLLHLPPLQTQVLLPRRRKPSLRRSRRALKPPTASPRSVWQASAPHPPVSPWPPRPPCPVRRQRHCATGGQ